MVDLSDLSTIRKRNKIDLSDLSSNNREEPQRRSVDLSDLSTQQPPQQPQQTVSRVDLSDLNSFNQVKQQELIQPELDQPKEKAGFIESGLGGLLSGLTLGAIDPVKDKEMSGLAKGANIAADIAGSILPFAGIEAATGPLPGGIGGFAARAAAKLGKPTMQALRTGAKVKKALGSPLGRAVTTGAIGGGLMKPDVPEGQSEVGDRATGALLGGLLGGVGQKALDVASPKIRQAVGKAFPELLTKEKTKFVKPIQKGFRFGDDAVAKNIDDDLMMDTINRITSNPDITDTRKKELFTKILDGDITAINLSDEITNSLDDYATNIGINRLHNGKIRNDLSQILTNPAERKAMFYYRESLNDPDLIGLLDPQTAQLVSNPTKSMLRANKIIGDQYKKQLRTLADNVDDLSIKERENFINRIFEMPKSEFGRSVNNASTLKTRLNEKLSTSLKKPGMRLKEDDALSLLEANGNVLSIVGERTKLLKDLSNLTTRTGSALVRTGDDKATRGWRQLTHPAFKKQFGNDTVRVHPEIEKAMVTLFGDKFSTNFNGVDVIKAFEDSNKILKGLQLGLSGFHLTALTEALVSTVGPTKAIKTAATSLYDAYKKKSPAIFRGENFKQAQKAIKHGVSLTPPSDIHKPFVDQALKDATFKLQQKSKLAGKAMEGVMKVKQGWDSAMWDHAFNNFKLQAFNHLEDKFTAGMTGAAKEARLREIGRFVNDTFGGQDLVRLMRDPKMQQIFQFGLLSPDWLESTTKQALSPLGIGAIKDKHFRGELGRHFWGRAAIYFGVGVNMLNWAISKATTGQGRFIWDNEPGHKTHLFAGKNKDGSNEYIRWGKQFRELPEFLYDASADEFSPISAATKKLGGKFSPNLQLASQIFTGRTLSGFTNKDINSKTGWDRAQGVASTIGKAALPFSLSSLFDKKKEFSPANIFLPTSKGMSYYTAKKLMIRAIADQDERMIEDVYKGAIDNGLNATDVFKDSIASVKREATLEIGRKIRNGELTSGNTDKEKKLLNKYKKELKESEQVIANWETELAKSLKGFREFQQPNRRL